MIPLEYGIGVCGHHHSAAFAHVWHHFGPAEVTSTTAGWGGGGLCSEPPAAKWVSGVVMGANRNPGEGHPV